MMVRFGWRPGVAAWCYHADSLWLQGRIAEALSTIRENVQRARDADHLPTLFYSLAHGACPVAVRAGDLDAAADYIDQLYAISEDSSYWRAWANCYEGAVLVRRGEAVSGVTMIADALAPLPETAFTHRRMTFLASLAQGQCASGQLREARATIEHSLERARRDRDLWCYPELLRIKGEILIKQEGAAAYDPAESLFQRSSRFALHREMGTWSLRTATSLAELQQLQNRHEEARALLEPVCRRFEAEDGWSDLAAARNVLRSSFLPEGMKKQDGTAHRMLHS